MTVGLRALGVHLLLEGGDEGGEGLVERLLDRLCDQVAQALLEWGREGWRGGCGGEGSGWRCRCGVVKLHHRVDGLWGTT